MACVNAIYETSPVIFTLNTLANVRNQIIFQETTRPLSMRLHP
jgi:hypothetical protein